MTWNLVKLGDVCNLKNGFAFKSKLFKEKGLPILRISNIQNERIDTRRPVYFNPSDYNIDFKKYEVKTGDLLIAMSGATTGKLGFNESQTTYYLNQRVGKLVPSKNLDKKFLYFILSTRVEENLKISKGAAQPNLSSEQIKNIIIPLPPLTEQQRIVAKLDAAFAEIDKEHDINIKLSKLIEKIQNTLLKFLLKKENVIEKVKLEDVCIIKGRIGYRGYTKKDITTKGKGAISLSPSNIDNNKITFKKNTYISWDKYNESPEIMIYQDDIIFCKTGSTYGKTAYIKDLPEKATLNPQLVVLKNIKCDNKFLFYSMLSDNFKFQIEDIIGGSAMPTLSQKDLSQTEILLPSENIQKNIVKKIETITKYSEKMNSNVKSKIENFLSLKSKILKKETNGISNERSRNKSRIN